MKPKTKPETFTSLRAFVRRFFPKSRLVLKSRPMTNEERRLTDDFFRKHFN